jgi:GTP-binding protein
MDILRLPSPLRRSLVTQSFAILNSQRHVATYTPRDDTFNPSQSPPPSSNLLVLSSATLNSYTTSVPPNPHQLKYAASFFHTTPPRILYSASHFRSFPPSPHPEVAFLGRSNVGKSSLLNALFGRTKEKAAHVSKRPGRTKTMNGFGVAGGLEWGTPPASGQQEGAWKRFPQGGLVVVDMPGYGSGSREVWGEEALKYLERRKQLRRTFVLVDAEHGLKRSDVTVLTHLRRQGVGYQIVLSKVDKVLLDGSKIPGPLKLSKRLRKLQEMCADMRRRLDEEVDDGRQAMGDILCCSSEHSFQESGHRKIGIDEVRWAVLGACGMESISSGQRRKKTLDGIMVLDEVD